MEFRDPIHGTIELSDVETLVIDSQAYQRLRQIKQLGFSEFSFPGATHNRFLHSLGVCHLAGLAFDSIFGKRKFSSEKVKLRFRQSLRLAALLHDIGHGPLSHTSEEVMPPLSDLKIDVYKKKKDSQNSENRKSDHEDYTIKFITDSQLSAVIAKNSHDINAYHVACLIDKQLPSEDDFFNDQGQDYRVIFSQIVSSEMDVDRMDYLERDAYFCGTNYGKVELNWLISNLSSHEFEGKLHLALNRKALYTFDDFLLARHHMHLMVYFHHKSIIYEEILYRYLTSKDCSFHLPANIEDYIHCTDYALYQHLAQVENPWAKRIAKRNTFKMLVELHSTSKNIRPQKMQERLQEEGIDVIFSNSTARLSKYHSASPEEKSYPIFVVDDYDHRAKTEPIDRSTEIFQKYEEIRMIDRLYVAPENYSKAESIVVDEML